jgi:ketosteroid isomerase-like protein
MSLLINGSAYSLLDVPVGRCTEEPSSNKRSPHQRKPRRERTMAQSSSTAIRDAIAAAIEKFMAAFSRGDAAGCAALYTEQGQLLPPNSDVIAGKQAIQTFWQSAMHMGITAVKLETAEVEGHGNTANEVGTYIRSSGSCAVISGIAAGQRQGSNPEPSLGYTRGGGGWANYK